MTFLAIILGTVIGRAICAAVAWGYRHRRAKPASAGLDDGVATFTVRGDFRP